MWETHSPGDTMDILFVKQEDKVSTTGSNNNTWHFATGTCLSSCWMHHLNRGMINILTGLQKDELLSLWGAWDSRGVHITFIQTELKPMIALSPPALIHNPVTFSCKIKVVEAPDLGKRKQQLLIQTLLLFSCDQIKHKVPKVEFQLIHLCRAVNLWALWITSSSLFKLV